MDKNDVLVTAKERFEYALERSSHNREKMRDDIRFAAASPDDPWQWEKADQVTRKGRPMLTINKMPQHIRQVTNDIRQNRPSIRFRPADDNADPEVADILMGLVKHIEANSDADIAYDTAAECQVVHGLGYIRVLTDYIRPDSFDQDIFIDRIKDPFKCYDDPDIQDPAGADRRFFFIEERMKEKEFKEEYPKADAIDWTFSKDEGWFTGEKEWQTANTANHAYLPYNHVDENGNPIPGPNRTQPATVETGLNQIAMGASDDIKAETGQYDASLGQKSNETSGRAIMARQREGDTATFHYVDNLARAVRHVGRIILDMIPRIYDTQRIALILGEDDSQSNVTIDPKNPEAMTEYRDEQGEIKRIFNPNIGTYDIYTTTGPSFTTRRVEAVEAMTSMTQANPQLWQVIGDLLIKNMDWPGAEEMADRMKLTLLPAVQQEMNKDAGAPEVPPQVQQAMQQMQEQMGQLDHVVQAMQSELEQKEQEAGAAKLAVQKAQSECISLKLEIEKRDALEEIRDAQEMQMPAEQAPQQPQQQQAPMVLPDVNGQLVGAIGPVLETLAATMQSTGEAVAVIAQGQQQLMQDMAADREQDMALLMELQRPKQTQVRIVKQADGSFVGEKIEG